MKTVFRICFLLAWALLISACGQNALPSTSTTIATSPTATNLPALEYTPTKSPYLTPTLLPTIEPEKIDETLASAFRMETLQGLNGHSMQKITGWDYGFGQNWCFGYLWMDSNHLALYPIVGQSRSMDGKWNIVSQIAILNTSAKTTWLPQSLKISEDFCYEVHWSEKLGIVITASLNANGKDIVSTFSFDGDLISTYDGKLESVSPSGEKILADEDRIIDLVNDRIVDLDWAINYERQIPRNRIFWSPDETRVYRCCFYWGNIITGHGYSFEVADFKGKGAKPSRRATHTFGEWVRNGEYFLIEWSRLDDGYPDFFPMFNPSTKTYYEVGEAAGIPEEWTCHDTNVSTNGLFVWIECWEGQYLVNLETFDSKSYPVQYVDDVVWSADGKFAWIASDDYNVPQMLSVSTKKLTLFTLDSLFDNPLWWHPTANVLAYISKDKNSLALLDAQTMSVQEIALPANFVEATWSPNGDEIALLAEDGSLWRIDYPGLKTLEQLTPPLPDVREVKWSPDGANVAFISGADIYIVNANIKP